MSAYVSRSEKNYSMCYMKWFLFVANFNYVSYVKTYSFLLYFQFSRNTYILKYV